MKYSTAKRYVIGYRKSAAKRGSVVRHHKLHRALKQMEEGLKINGLLGVY
jgi:hypothetical protein